MHPDRLPHQAYHMLLNMDGSGKETWASSVRKILSVCGFYYVWLQQGVGNVNAFLRIFKTRLQDMFIQEWSATIHDKERFALFHLFKTEFKEESYIVDLDIFCFRVALSQLRFGVLPINNNSHRYSENVLARNCPFCKTIVEDERHFLFDCPLYDVLRNRFLSNRPFTVADLLRWKDPVRVKALSKFVFHAFKKRRDIVDV